MVCMGKYYWSKKDKVVMKRGAKRTREGSTKHMPAPSHIIWKLDTPDSKQGALDTVVVIGSFKGANYDSVSQLSVILTDKEQEVEKVKPDLAVAEAKHEQEVKEMKQ